MIPMFIHTTFVQFVYRVDDDLSKPVVTHGS